MRKIKTHADIKAKVDSQKWFYSNTVKDHFFKPRNFLDGTKAEKYKYDGLGLVGSPACGDMMKVWIKVDKKKDKIKEMKWATFGCASAIASTSMLSLIVSENGGMKIDKALKIKPQDITERLKGLPTRKFHCSVLGDKALRGAINDYFRKTNQNTRIVLEGARVIDKETNVTDKDIEEAVLEGAYTLQEIQEKLKVGVSNKSCVPEVEQLIKFYNEKYFGNPSQ
ncbi:iron-sulfur cluster assembly scaffold protein [Candidatus Pacearchaeota archaeon]|nr:iron-sulfur cluster assembly scaffold protein [Candidatus Pacearchaeota archaeon]